MAVARVLLPLLVITAVAQQPPNLRLSHRIGADWEPGPYQWMNFVAISADGKSVASNGALPAGAKGTGIWTFPDGKFLRTIPGNPKSISSDFRYLATEDRVIDLTTDRTAVKLSAGQHLWTQTVFSPNAEYFASAAYLDNGKPDRPSIQVVKLSDRSVVSRFGLRHVSALAVHPDNRRLASGHWDNVTLWDLETGKRLALLPGFGRYVYGIGFSRDGRLLAAGTDDGQLQIWDIESRTRLQSLRLGWGDVSNPAFSPDGKLVAAGTYADGTLTVVDVSSGAIVSQTKVSMFGCGAVAFTPDGQYLLAPSNGGQLGPHQFDRGGSIRAFRVRE